jgi:hypothetical protein
MASDDEKDFFDRLGEILNAPLPGTRKAGSPTPQASDAEADDEESLLERIKDILTSPLPGTALPEGDESIESADSTRPVTAGPAADSDPQPEASLAPPVPGAEELEESWWDRDWAAFQAHQDRERGVFNIKQRRDQETFAKYQEQEKLRFDGHQKQEFELFRRQQQWKLDNWKQQIEQQARRQGPPPGWQPPPSPWGAVPPPSPFPGQFPPPPGMFPPPWARGRKR